MKSIDHSSLIRFEFVAMDFAADCEVKTKDDIERFSALLHEHLENAMADYAIDEGIEDYEFQY